MAPAIEHWRPVPGLDGIEASDLGRIRNVTTGRIRRPTPSRSKGYLQVCLSINARPKTFWAHRLVALAHVPNPGAKPHVNHRNSERTDNRAVNLEWVTPAENAGHASRAGRLVRRRTRRFRRVSIERIRSSSQTAVKLAERYGVSKSTIASIRRRESYADIR